MSLEKQFKDRIDRSCHLTLKQYNIVLSYLNTGIKPPIRTLEDADLLGNLNGGANKSGRFHRLKSIASRLALRPDGALLFASNGKVVIPSSKFVSTIKQAHRGTSEKHLNCSQTLAKLQETYTIGRRQFGICEDQIRDVVKSCNQGSCRNSRKHKRISNYGTPAKKAKHDSEEPNEQPKEKGSLLKSLLAVNMYQSPAEGSQTTYIPNVAPVLPQTLSQSAVPPGDVQTSLNTKSCIFVINSNLAMPSSSLTDLNSFTNLQNTGSNNSSLINPQTTGQTNYVYILPTTQATESPLKVQPVLRSLQTPVGTNIVYIPNLINASIIPQSNVQVLYNSIPTTLLKETDVSTLSDMKSVINSFSSSVDENNNLQSLDCSRPAILETDDDFDHSKCSDLDFPCQPDLGFGSDEDYDGADELSPTGSRGNKNVIDKDMVSDEDIVPFPQIWHYFQDLNSEKNPYQKINIAIQDMKLDMMRSLIGDSIAAERLKKKISYLDHLVKMEKNVTTQTSHNHYEFCT